MYLSYFGLHKWPFKLTPDLGFFFRQASREAVVEALQYAIARGDAVVKVSGAVGVGKTMLLRLLTQRLSGDYQIVYLSAPNLSPMDILRVICAELSITLSGQENKADLLGLIQKALIERYQADQRVVMLGDEAQALTLDALEEIRLLGNLETEWDKLLQVVLFGQPELDKTLEDPRIRPLKDRLACNVTLSPLTAKEVKEYLNYRMRIAGYLETDFFNDQAARKVQRVTGGLPRSINLMADKLLMAVFASGDKRLKNKHFQQAGVPAKQNLKVLLISLFAGIGVLASAYFVTTGPMKAVLYEDETVTSESGARVDDKPIQDVVMNQRTDQTAEIDEQSDHSAKKGEAVRPKSEDSAASVQSDKTITAVKESASKASEPSKETLHASQAATASSKEVLSAERMGQDYQAWAEKLGVAPAQLLKLLTLHEQLRVYLASAPDDRALLVLAPEEVSVFSEVYERLMRRLSWENREHVYALVKPSGQTGQKIQYQLVYDPRTSGQSSLQNKAGQLKMLTNASRVQTATAREVRAIIAEK
jgi:type II secretory pathway predicted ATPase ExeA